MTLAGTFGKTITGEMIDGTNTTLQFVGDEGLLDRYKNPNKHGKPTKIKD